MKINITEQIPDDLNFHKLIEDFVFNCPSATVTSKKKAKTKQWDNVSVRECSFRNRGITGTLLNTITAQIKRMMKNELYKKVDKIELVEDVFDASNSNERIVFRDNSQMSDAEVIYYYIRNAFAHGSFEVTSDRVYKLESKKKESVKAQMMLKETTLLKIADLSRKNRKQIEALQKKKNRN